MEVEGVDVGLCAATEADKYEIVRLVLVRVARGVDYPKRSELVGVVQNQRKYSW